MELDELQRRILHIQELERLESMSPKSYNPSEGMSPEEMSRYILFLFEQLQQKDALYNDLSEQLAGIQAELKSTNSELKRAYSELKSSNSEQKRLNALVLSLTNQLNEALHNLQELQRENEDLKASARVSKKHRFGSPSQKGITNKKEVSGRDDNKDDFDGTAGSLSVCNDLESTGEMLSEAPAVNRASRKGCTNTKMSADCQVLHECDMTRIPSGAIVLKKSIRKVFDSVNLIVEHDFEEVTYKTADGCIHTSYFPMADDKEAHIYNERVQGTHATSSLLSTLVFNRYQLSTPTYRELSRMVEMKMSVCRQTLTNWFSKAAEQFSKLIPAMKDEALCEGANVNVDETWCRYHTRFGHKKHYIWCLANRAAKTVIFFYDEGKRNRNVLRDFLGDSKINSLQSDGYNVYMYLDNELHDIEHLCCMAHVRAKFKYALEQGLDTRARYFLEKIAWLYECERKYKEMDLSPEEIKEERQSAEVEKVITQLRKKLDFHLYFDKSPQGELMRKALTYMDSFWKQLFKYRNDGNYTIDNSLAERSIRPLTMERKNSLFFCSTEGAKTSAIFHTIIETCKQLGLSAKEYIKDFLQAIASGRSDWQNLTPAKIYLQN